MAANNYLQRCDSVEDDYIDMEVSAFSSNFFCNSNNNDGEFEFQMSNRFLDRDSTLTSPADELFYKGTLLPLHLPPRLLMVKKLLETTKDYSFDDFYISTGPLATTTTTVTPTPFQSCNVSPAESCQVSKELNAEEYFDVENSKNSWTRKLRLMKQSSFGSKLKASKSYLRWFFRNSSCSNVSCTSAAKVVDEVKFSKIEFTKNPFGQIQHKRHRRSFSESMRRQSTNNSIQMPLNSNTAEVSRFHQLQLLKRSSTSSTTSSSEIENPIQGAILHCKQSLLQLHHHHTGGRD